MSTPNTSKNWHIRPFSKV